MLLQAPQKILTKLYLLLKGHETTARQADLCLTLHAITNDHGQPSQLGLDKHQGCKTEMLLMSAAFCQKHDSTQTTIFNPVLVHSALINMTSFTIQ
jgi:hypothetical protein